MTPDQLRAEIDRCIHTIVQQGLAVDTNPTVANGGGHVTVVSWARTSEGPFGAYHGAHATVAEYLHTVKERDYNCILADGGLLQMTYWLRYQDVAKHRLCYYPCPVVLDPDDLAYASVEELVEWHLTSQPTDPRPPSVTEPVSELGSKLGLRAAVRFDYDIQAQAADHAASHLHLSHEDCRWPVFGPISVGHFVRFVFRHFYSEAWGRCATLRDWPLHAQNRSITPLEETELYIECSAVDHAEGAAEGP